MVAQNIDEYIAGFPMEIRSRMETLRAAIRKAVPEASEKISWAMPTFYLNGNLVHFAGYKNHIGLYPGVEAIEVFADELAPYKTSKGWIQFPHDKPLPLELIVKIVEFNEKNRLCSRKKGVMV